MSATNPAKHNPYNAVAKRKEKTPQHNNKTKHIKFEIPTELQDDCFAYKLNNYVYGHKINPAKRPKYKAFGTYAGKINRRRINYKSLEEGIYKAERDENFIKYAYSANKIPDRYIFMKN